MTLRIAGKPSLLPQWGMLPPSVDVALRAATVDDAGEVLTLQLAAWVAEGRRHHTFDIPPLTQSLDEVREDLRTETALVATLGARIVGTVRAHLLAVPPATAWYIGRLGVVPDLQGFGIGGRLLRGIEALAGSEESRYVLTTGPNSADNIAFYERHGYLRVAPDDTVGPPHLVHLSKERP